MDDSFKSLVPTHESKHSDRMSSSSFIRKPELWWDVRQPVKCRCARLINITRCMKSDGGRTPRKKSSIMSKSSKMKDFPRKDPNNDVQVFTDALKRIRETLRATPSLLPLLPGAVSC